MAQERSGTAIGFTMFAAFMMIMAGTFHIISGLAGILEDEFWTLAPNLATEEGGDVYFLQFDATTWGWVHMLVGIVVLLAGLALFKGSVWARTVGVILALISALVNFAFLPWYPFWSITMIVVSIFVIWALTVHGRDIAEG